MSIKIQREFLAQVEKGVQLHHAMHQKADEMIELMKIVKMDSLRRQNQYKKIQKALNLGQIKEAKKLFYEMMSWKKYKINF